MMTERELAAYLRCTPGSLRMKRFRGQGPAAIKSGRIIRYRVSDVNAWLAGHSTAPASTGTAA